MFFKKLFGGRVEEPKEPKGPERGPMLISGFDTADIAALTADFAAFTAQCAGRPLGHIRFAEEQASALRSRGNPVTPELAAMWEWEIAHLQSLRQEPVEF